MYDTRPPRTEEDSRPAAELLVAKLAQSDPCRQWIIEGESMGLECHFCQGHDVVGNGEEIEHEPDCLWFQARQWITVFPDGKRRG